MQLKKVVHFLIIQMAFLNIYMKFSCAHPLILALRSPYYLVTNLPHWSAFFRFRTFHSSFINCRVEILKWPVLYILRIKLYVSFHLFLLKLFLTRKYLVPQFLYHCFRQTPQAVAENVFNILILSPSIDHVFQLEKKILIWKWQSARRPRTCSIWGTSNKEFYGNDKTVIWV